MNKTDFKQGNKITLTLKSKNAKKYILHFMDKFRQMSHDDIDFSSFFVRNRGIKYGEIMSGVGRDDNGMGAIDFANDVVKKIGTTEIINSSCGIINMKDIKDYNIKSEIIDCPVHHYHCAAD